MVGSTYPFLYCIVTITCHCENSLTSSWEVAVCQAVKGVKLITREIPTSSGLVCTT